MTKIAASVTSDDERIPQQRQLVGKVLGVKKMLFLQQDNVTNIINKYVFPASKCRPRLNRFRREKSCEKSSINVVN